jgi:hypothetical protein
MSNPPFYLSEPRAYCLEPDCAWHGRPEDCGGSDRSDFICPLCHSDHLIVNDPSAD